MRLLLAGGSRDPHLACLARAAAAEGIEPLLFPAGPGGAGEIAVDPGDGTLRLFGRPAPEIAAAFLRADVFGRGPAAARQAAEAALACLRGWLAATPPVRVFNRDPFGRSRSVNKLAALAAARAAGLAIPRTVAGNGPDALALLAAGTGEVVAKPVGGGDHARLLAPGEAPGPAILQERLEPPELRVFAVGGAMLGFRIVSPALDYRTDRAARIEPTEVPPEIAAPLGRLLAAMGLDFSASDFKRSPARDRPVYLETNANPMFAAFDRASGGALARAMLAALLPGRVSA